MSTVKVASMAPAGVSQCLEDPYLFGVVRDAQEAFAAGTPGRYDAHAVNGS